MRKSMRTWAAATCSAQPFLTTIPAFPPLPSGCAIMPAVQGDLWCFTDGLVFIAHDTR